MKTVTEELKEINEAIIRAADSLDPSITNSIYYPRLKQLMFKEIVDFCKEKLELKEDLLELQNFIGLKLSEQEIREYLDELKIKYNMVENIGLDYHIEATRVDYGVCVFVTIRRNDIFMKKFVFRFRKASTDTIFGLSNGGVIDKTQQDKIRDTYYDTLTSIVSSGGI